VSCEARAALAALAGPSSTPSVVSIVLLPSSAVNATAAAGTNQTLFLEYGRLAPLSLAPCPRNTSLTTSVVTCAAVAWDDQEGDLSPFMDMPQDVSPGSQPRCSAASLTSGTCLPGRYTLVYFATNSAGTATATALLTVYVEQRSSVLLNYSFVSPTATDGAATQLLAAQLLANASYAQQLVVGTQLAAFGITTSYQPQAGGPSSQRVVQAVVMAAAA
ncbi:uncharacterized protein HaLaN_13226, partial [Haematococcus lacustris]